MFQQVMFPITINNGYSQRTEGQLRLSTLAMKSIHTLWKVNHAQTHLATL